MRVMGVMMHVSRIPGLGCALHAAPPSKALMALMALNPHLMALMALNPHVMALMALNP